MEGAPQGPPHGGLPRMDSKSNDHFFRGEVDPEQLVLNKKKVLGRGSFGVVYEGRFFDEKVAVKELLVSEWTAAEAQEFRQEFEIQYNLRHERIVQLKGACTHQPPYRIVMELMSCTLKSVIDDKSVEMDLRERVRYMREICEGLKFLHSQTVRGVPRPITHRDIKSSNILVRKKAGGGYVMKLSDFGKAALNRNTMSTSGLNAPVGSVPWMAPEIMKCERYTPAADMYSFATVCWELLTRLTPYKECREAWQIVGKVLDKDERLQVPDECPETLREIFERCWDKDFKRRLTAGEVLEMLKKLEEQLSSAPKPGPSSSPAAPKPQPADMSREAEGYMSARLSNTHKRFLFDMANRIVVSDPPPPRETLEAFVLALADRLQDPQLERELRQVSIMPDVIDFWRASLTELRAASPQGPWPRESLRKLAERAFEMTDLNDLKFQELCSIVGLPYADGYSADQFRTFCFWVCPAAQLYKQTKQLFEPISGDVPWGEAFMTTQRAQGMIAESSSGTFLLRLSTRSWPDEWAGTISVTYKENDTQSVLHSRLVGQTTADVQAEIKAYPEVYRRVFYAREEQSNYIMPTRPGRTQTNPVRR
eukprot:tig00000459_g1078.t1